MVLILLSIGLVAIAFIALGISIFFRKDGKFPETEIGHNRHMKELGIYCVKCEERRKWNELQARKSVVRIPAETGIDFSAFR